MGRWSKLVPASPSQPTYFSAGKNSVCKNVFLHDKTFFLSANIEAYLPTKNTSFPSFPMVYYKGYLSANLLFFYYHNSATNQKDFFTCLGQIFTRRTGESHPGQFNRTPAQRTFSSFTICLISFFQVLPEQPFKAFAPAVCTSSPSAMPWWSKTTSM